MKGQRARGKDGTERGRGAEGKKEDKRRQRRLTNDT